MNNFLVRVTFSKLSIPVYREFSINDEITLHQFHKIIQRVLNYSSEHLYAFIIDDIAFTIKDEYQPEDDINSDSKNIKISQLCFKKEETFRYFYNFEDDWEFEVRILEITETDEFNDSIILCGGLNNIPPENCGGIELYNSFVDAVTSNDTSLIESIKSETKIDLDIHLFNIDHENERLQEKITEVIPETKNNEIFW